MYYPDELVEEVRSQNDIVDVVGSYVKLQKKGSSYFGLCPFHNEKSASFSVSAQRQMFYCFGCGAGGNVFTFLMKYENYTFPEAIKQLADRVGVKLPEAEYSAEQKQRESKRTQLLELNKEAAKYFYYQLKSPNGDIGYRYLTNRELSEDTIKHFGLGFANQTSDDLVKYLKSKGYSDDLIIEAGLASHDEKWGMHDKFWNRVMFPIQDVNHKVIGFGGRVMGDGKPKYLNSPETMIFDKSRNLYGLNYAKSSRQNNIILCEGYMDVIAMHQAGFTQAAASLGTALTVGHANLLRKYTKDVLLAYDSDGAGVNAAIRAIHILRDAELTSRIINMEPYKDPDEFIKNLGADAFKERIDNAENSFLFEVRIKEREYDLKDPDKKTAFFKEVAKMLCEFEDEMVRENYLEAVADKYSVSFEGLRKQVLSQAEKTGLVKPIERSKLGNAASKERSQQDAQNKPQRLLLTWLSEMPQLYSQIKKYISDEDFTDPLYKQVATRLFDEYENGEGNPAAIISMFQDEEEQQIVASLFHTTLPEMENDREKEKAFRDIIYSVKRNSFEYYSKQMGTDTSALNKVIEGKKALEELKKVSFSLNA